MDFVDSLKNVRNSLQKALTVDDSFTDARDAVPTVGNIVVFAASDSLDAEDGHYVGVVLVDNPIVGDWLIPAADGVSDLYVRFWKKASQELAEVFLETI